MSIREVILPWLDVPEMIRAAQVANQLQADRAAIIAAQFPNQALVLLDEARRIADSEDARRNGADARATTYLALVGVLAPILAALAPAATDPSKDFPRAIVSLVLFAAAGVYLFGCGLWSFKALKVAPMGRVGHANIIEASQEAEPDAYLIRIILRCVLFSHAQVNAKVTCIKMAHAYGFRALVVSVAAMMIRLGWEPTCKLIGLLG